MHGASVAIDPRKLMPPLFFALILLLALIPPGCGTTQVAPSAAEPQVIVMGGDQFADVTRLLREMRTNPDLSAWQQQREAMALALGDRQFEQSRDRMFDSMVTALASVGARVYNIERASGYITAAAPQLPPDEFERLNQQSARAYLAAKGHSGDNVEQVVMGLSRQMPSAHTMTGLTLSMTSQGAERTKVKLRFDNVYYPGLLEVYYKVVWQAVDKQMFLDKGLD